MSAEAQQALAQAREQQLGDVRNEEPVAEPSKISKKSKLTPEQRAARKAEKAQYEYVRSN